MPQIKIVFSDVDNTLITSQNKILPVVATTVSDYVKDGGTFVLASARPPRGMEVLAKELGTTAIMITLNGALVLQKKAGETDVQTLFEKTMLPVVLPRLLEIVAAQNLAISLNVFAGEEWFAQKHDAWVSQEEQITGACATIGAFSSQLGNARQPLHKILCMGEPAEIDHLEKQLDLAPKLQVSYQRSKPTYLEIVQKDVSKMEAIKQVAELLQIPLSQTMALGDGDNDLPMIKDAGIGVAVSNAFPTVKAVADHIVSSNDEGGVAEALLKYTGLSKK